MLIFLYLLWTWSPHFYSSYHFFFFPLFSFMLCSTKAGGRRRHGSVHPSTQRGESPVAPWLSNEKQPRQFLSFSLSLSLSPSFVVFFIRKTKKKSFFFRLLNKEKLDAVLFSLINSLMIYHIFSLLTLCWKIHQTDADWILLSDELKRL